MTMIQKLRAFFTLPDEISALERQHLERTHQVAMWIGIGHLPLLMAVAWICDTDPLKALLFTPVVLVGPWIAMRTMKNPRHISMVIAVAAMCLGGLLVHFGQGPMQIEMHFYFFASLALLTTFLDPKVVLVGAATVALHHLLLYFLLPTSLLNYEASVWVVAVHAAFVVFESFPATSIARRQFDLIVGLEKKIDERTSELNQQKARLDQVFDTVEEGLAVIDVHGAWGGPRSSALLAAIPNAGEHERFVDALAAYDEAAALEVEIALEAIRDGFLPEELLLAQFPSRFSVEDATFEMRPIRLHDDERDLFLLVVNDITLELAHAEERRRQNQALALMKRATDDPDAVLSFLRTGSDYVETVETADDDIVTTMRALHTLKGNAGIVGLQAFAHLCHELEDEIRDTTAAPSDPSKAQLRAAWDELEKDVATVLNLDNADDVRIPRDDYASLIASLEAAIESGSLEQRLRWWSFEPTERPLQRLGQQARQIARRLGRSQLEIDIVSNGIRLPTERYDEIWSTLVHVVRNAVDHGFDSVPDDAPQRIELVTELRGDDVVVRVSDNGGGVDWAKLRAKAEASGVQVDRDADLLFADGLSSRDEVTDLSGRGVGLAAIRHAVESIDGRVDVTSEKGAGTSFEFSFRAPTASVAVVRDAA